MDIETVASPIEIAFEEDEPPIMENPETDPTSELNVLDVGEDPIVSGEEETVSTEELFFEDEYAVESAEDTLEGDSTIELVDDPEFVEKDPTLEKKETEDPEATIALEPTAGEINERIKTVYADVYLGWESQNGFRVYVSAEIITVEPIHRKELFINKNVSVTIGKEDEFVMNGGFHVKDNGYDTFVMAEIISVIFPEQIFALDLADKLRKWTLLKIQKSESYQIQASVGDADYLITVNDKARTVTSCKNILGSKKQTIKRNVVFGSISELEPTGTPGQLNISTDDLMLEGNRNVHAMKVFLWSALEARKETVLIDFADDVLEDMVTTYGLVTREGKIMAQSRTFVDGVNDLNSIVYNSSTFRPLLAERNRVDENPSLILSSPPIKVVKTFSAPKSKIVDVTTSREVSPRPFQVSISSLSSEPPSESLGGGSLETTTTVQKPIIERKVITPELILPSEKGEKEEEEEIFIDLASLTFNNSAIEDLIVAYKNSNVDAVKRILENDENLKNGLSQLEGGNFMTRIGVFLNTLMQINNFNAEVVGTMTSAARYTNTLASLNNKLVVDRAGISFDDISKNESKLVEGITEFILLSVGSAIDFASTNVNANTASGITPSEALLGIGNVSTNSMTVVLLKMLERQYDVKTDITREFKAQLMLSPFANLLYESLQGTQNGILTFTQFREIVDLF